MATFNGVSYIDPRNINLKGGSKGSGVIRFSQQGVSNWSSNPFESTAAGLYVNAAGALVYSYLGTTTVLGAAGAGGTPTWSQIYAGQSTFTLTGTTWTIDNNTGNNDVLTLTNTGAGSGDIVQITNAGTGKDINGTSGTWSVTKLGAAAFLSVATATVNGAGAGITIGDSGANVVTIGTNTNTITMAKATTFSSTIAVTDGAVTLGSTSNVAADLQDTNNTITTFGATATASQGQVVIRSTSLTTGTQLRLQLAEAALTTGKYLEALDSTGVATVFSIAKTGATTILGSAFATAALTLTNGDAVISSGKLLVTAASNAAAMAVFTNNTATSQSVFKVAGSGVHTGTTTTSFTTITASGLTTGTLAYFSADVATTSVGVLDVSVAGLTSGSALRITAGTAAFTTGGKLIELTSTAAVAGNHLTATTTGAYTGTGMILVTAGAATTGVLVSVISTTGLTTGSLIRATSSTAGAIATNGAIAFVGTGNFTNSVATLGYVSVRTDTTTAGTAMSVSGTAMTTGIALSLLSSGTGMTSGSLFRASTGTTGAVATNGIVSIRATGAYTSTSNAGLLDVQASAATGAATVFNLQSTAASQTAVRILNVIQSGATMTAYTGTIAQFTGGFSGASSTGNIIGVTAVNDVAGDAIKVTNTALTLGSGTLMNLSHTTSVIGAGSSMLRLTSTGVNTGTTTGTMLDIAATAATTATLALITSATLTTGSAMVMNLNGLTTGTGLTIAHTTSVIANGGSLMRLSSTSIDTSTTTGAILDMSSTAGAASVNILAAFNGLTTGKGMRMTTTNLSTGLALELVATSATLSTGRYFSANDGTGEVFGVGANGHLHTTLGGATAPVMTTNATGITATAIVAGSTDVNGSFTTTGTPQSGTVLTCTFHKTYTTAPKFVVISPINASAGNPNTVPYVSSITATTFVLTWPAGGTYAATPSYAYMVIA